jgi:Uncharacterized protein conserved in bacteria (DUF2242)
MRNRKTGLAMGSAILAATVVAGCASNKHNVTHGPFYSGAPFSKTIDGAGDVVCWSVKRAILSQGYMLERSSEPGVLTGSRDYQPNDKLNVTVHLQTTCADNRNGTSIVFVTAEREESQLQKMKQTTSAGIGPATITMPSGSAKVLGTIRRETIQDPNFYNSFFSLVQGFVAQEGQSRPERHAELRNPEALNSEPAAQPPSQNASPSPPPQDNRSPPPQDNQLPPPQDNQGR